MQYTVDNNKLANLIFSNNYATREQIMQLWPYIAPGRDIGQLLVTQGVLPLQVYQKMVVFLNQQNTVSQTPSQQSAARLVQHKGSPQQTAKPRQAGQQVQAAQAYQQTTQPRNSMQPQKSALPKTSPGRQPETASANVQPKAVRPGKSVVPNNLQIVNTQDELCQDIALVPAADEICSTGSDDVFIDSLQYGEKLHTDNAERVTTDISDTGNDIPDIRELFKYARSVDASDVHLSVNNPVIVRRYGVLVPLNDALVSADYMQSQIRLLLNDELFGSFSDSGDLECVLEVEGAGRFRVTVMKQRAGWDCTARCIPDRIRTFEETGMPQACRWLTEWAQGLVLVTGPACCGKSSTLGTLIEMLNQSRPDHIITIESPVEQVYTSAMAQITQRQIGRDTVNQEAALRAALREDPDIIVVGELRDLSTIQLAVSAAETGHLVFGTMNTINASRTIYRLIDSFPPEEQSIIRNMVSESLRGVISQQLVPRLDGSGLVAAYEVLLVNSAVANMIRKDEAHQLGTAMITGKASGMQLLDDSLKALAAQGIISQQEALSRCVMKSQG